MDIGWNFRREHLRLQQRSHYVITNGGDQPNVVPPNASVWYYFREVSYPAIKQMWEIGDKMAEAAAMMTDTTVTSTVLGSAWPGHFNKTIAEAMYANIEKVGLPQWSEADQALAHALQHELKVPGGRARHQAEAAARPRGDAGRGKARRRLRRHRRHLVERADRRPALSVEHGGRPGHNWANAISMATPIAHKGIQAGAKVVALTVIDFLMKPELTTQAWDYFRNVQTKTTKYVPLIRPTDKPAIWLNKERMEKYRPEMKKFYYDPTKYKNYLEQLGIKYPTTEKPAVKIKNCIELGIKHAPCEMVGRCRGLCRHRLAERGASAAGARAAAAPPARS